MLLFPELVGTWNQIDGRVRQAYPAVVKLLGECSLTPRNRGYTFRWRTQQTLDSRTCLG